MTPSRPAHAAVILARVSAVSQVDGTSLDGQVEVCQKTAAAMGLPIIQTYIEPGISGAYLSLREGMQAAMKDIQEGRADHLITMNVTRYARDAELAHMIKKAVKKAGGRIIFADMPLEDTPEGELAFGIFSSFAQYERQVIIKRTTEGRKRLAATGVQPCRNFHPYGYEITSNRDVLQGRAQSSEIGTYTIVEAEAVWVREMFTQYANGTSLRAICRFLNEHHVATPRNGQYWRVSTIKRIMDNPTYYGKAPFGRTQNHYDENRIERGLKLICYRTVRPEDEWILIDVPAIVSREIWEQCQVRLTEGQSVYGGNPVHKHMLGGLLRCPICHRGMQGQKRMKPSHGRRIPSNVYHCPDSRPSRNPGGVVCNPKQYNGFVIEQIVTKSVTLLVDQPVVLAQAITQFLAARRQQSSPREVEHLKAQLQNLAERETATARAQVDAMVARRSTEVYTTILDEYTKEKARLTKQLEALQRLQVVSTQLRPVDQAQMVANLLEDVKIALYSPHVTDGERHDLLAKVIEEILPEENGYRIRFRPLWAKQPENVSTVANISIYATVDTINIIMTP